MDYDVRIESFSTIADKDNHADAGAPLSRSRRQIVFDGIGGPPAGVPHTVNGHLFPRPPIESIVDYPSQFWLD